MGTISMTEVKDIPQINANQKVTTYDLSLSNVAYATNGVQITASHFPSGAKEFTTIENIEFDLGSNIDAANDFIMSVPKATLNASATNLFKLLMYTSTTGGGPPQQVGNTNVVNTSARIKITGTPA